MFPRDFDIFLMCLCEKIDNFLVDCVSILVTVKPVYLFLKANYDSEIGYPSFFFDLCYHRLFRAFIVLTISFTNIPVSFLLLKKHKYYVAHLRYKKNGS